MSGHPHSSPVSARPHALFADGNMGIEALVCVLPEARKTVQTLVQEAGAGDEYLQRLLANGLLSIPVDDEGSSVATLVTRAIRRLVADVPSVPSRTIAILYGHSLPFYAPEGHAFFETATEGLPFGDVPGIAIGGQPCSVMHSVVRLAAGMVAAAGDDHGVLVIGADKAYRPTERLFFGSAMGDGSVAMFISRRGASDRILSCISDTHIDAFDGERSDADAIAAFRAANPARIRVAIMRCLSEAGLTIDQVKYLVPHTPYGAIWDLVADLLRIDRARILTDYLGETGHLSSNDVFVHYERAVRDGLITAGDLTLLVSPGFGGTRGCTLIRR